MENTSYIHNQLDFQIQFCRISRMKYVDLFKELLGC